MIYDQAAQRIEQAGFTVIRDPIEGFVSENGERLDTNYLNWVVGNGFVIAVGFGDDYLDERASERIQSYFPKRDIHMVEMRDSWFSGGGAHCHTNDQPAISTINTQLETLLGQ